MLFPEVTYWQQVIYLVFVLYSKRLSLLNWTNLCENIVSPNCFAVPANSLCTVELAFKEVQTLAVKNLTHRFASSYDGYAILMSPNKGSETAVHLAATAVVIYDWRARVRNWPIPRSWYVCFSALGIVSSIPAQPRPSTASIFRVTNDESTLIMIF